MTATDDTRAYVIFCVGQESYALPVEVVTGVVRFESPMPVPRAPRAVMGVVNLRGRVLPVIDLKARFGSGVFSAGAHARIVVAEGPSGPVGVAVDAATEVVTFAAEEIRPVPAGVLGPDTTAAFAGMVEREDGLVILLDPEHALLANQTDSAQPRSTDTHREEGSDA